MQTAPGEGGCLFRGSFSGDWREFSQKFSLQCSGRILDGMESLLNTQLGDHDLGSMFPSGGKWWVRSEFVEPQGRSVFQQLNEGFHLVRKTLDNERVVFRERAEKMVGGLRRKFLTLLVTCMKKASSHLQ